MLNTKVTNLPLVTPQIVSIGMVPFGELRRIYTLTWFAQFIAKRWINPSPSTSRSLETMTVVLGLPRLYLMFPTNERQLDLLHDIIKSVIMAMSYEKFDASEYFKESKL